MRVAILLAAGRSQRFGRSDKLMQPFRGEPLLLHSLRAARAAPAVRVIVAAATGSRVAMLRRHLRPGDRIVRVDQPELGVSESLKSAFAVMRPCEREAYLFLGDMPLVPLGLAGCLVPLRGEGMRPQHRGEPGHPVLVRRPGAAVLKSLRGDAGLRVPAGSVNGGAGCVADVDTPRALMRLRLAPLRHRHLREGGNP